MNNNTSLPQPNQPIFVLQVRPSPKPGAVRAYADIQYHGATIKGLSIVRHNGGHFVGFPSTLGKNGKRFPIVEFSEPERSHVAKLVLDAAKELL
jgi:DNA-binding cell septation regulator SpoVG